MSETRYVTPTAFKDQFCTKKHVPRFNALGQVSRFASPADAFRWLKMPGVSIVTPEPPKPLTRRCECGKPISKGRVCCQACGLRELQGIAACITTPSELNRFLDQFAQTVRGEMQPSERYAVLEAMGPYLHIGPEPDPPEPVESDESYEASESLMKAQTKSISRKIS